MSPRQSQGRALITKILYECTVIYRIAQNFGGGKLWRISAQSIFGGENIGGLVILSALEIDPVYVLLECFSKTLCLFRCRVKIAV